MSHRLGISWGLNQEQQQVGQGPKTSSTADEEICNNKKRNKGSVRIMREQLWSQRKTHWAKMICCGGTLTVKCQPKESKRLKWRYMREDIESSRRGESSDIREEGCTIVDQCSKDGVWPRAAVQHLFVEGLSRKTQTRTACMQVEDQGSSS